MGPSRGPPRRFWVKQHLISNPSIPSQAGSLFTGAGKHRNPFPVMVSGGRRKTWTAAALGTPGDSGGDKYVLRFRELRSTRAGEFSYYLLNEQLNEDILVNGLIKSFLTSRGSQGSAAAAWEEDSLQEFTQKETNDAQQDQDAVVSVTHFCSSKTQKSSEAALPPQS